MVTAQPRRLILCTIEALCVSRKKDVVFSTTNRLTGGLTS